VIVSAATPYRPLMTFETVATETPATRATSVIVVRCCGAATLVSMLTGDTIQEWHAEFAHLGVIDNVIENDIEIVIDIV
jgi:hypothetical protein